MKFSRIRHDHEEVIKLNGRTLQALRHRFHVGQREWLLLHRLQRQQRLWWRHRFPMPSSVNFAIILKEAFLHLSVLNSFSILIVWLCIFIWQMNSDAKAAPKMLVKLHIKLDAEPIRFENESQISGLINLWKNGKSY